MSTGVVGLHHVQLAVPLGSEDALRWFYGEVLGLPEVAKPPASHGVEVLWDLAFPGYRRCYVADPHGNRLELLEPVSAAPAAPAKTAAS